MDARRPPIPPPTMGMESVGQNLTILEHGHVAYQIKGNQDCSNMVANILPTDPTPDNCDGLKFNFFQSMAMFYNKLKGTEHRAPYKHILSPFTHLQPVGLIKRQNKIRMWSCCISNLRGKKYRLT